MTDQFTAKLPPGILPEDLEVLPLECSHTIPAHWYTDESIYQFETMSILRAGWQYIGHVSQIPDRGDYLVGEALGKPVILVRTSESEILGFYNVCRHRGGPLARSNGKGRVLRCLYHAWTYSLEGNLIGTPKFDGVKNFCKEDNPLEPIAVGIHDGLLFVNLSKSPTPIKDFFGGIAEEIAPISLNDMRFVQRELYSVKANWKVYIDNYLEGYHIDPIHPELAKVLDVSGYSTRICSNQVIQTGPIAAEDNPYHTQGTAYYYYVFPNLMLNIMPNRVQVNSIVPISRTETLTIFDYYYGRDLLDASDVHQDDQKFSDLIQRQDVEICEQVQKGLESGSYTKGRFSVSDELGVYGFQRLLKEALQQFS